MNNGQTIGYARVSTTDQDLTTQYRFLQELGCEIVFAEKVSGASSSRPELQNLLEYVREGDVVHVIKLDRLARNAQDALEIADSLQAKKVGLVIHDLGNMDINSEVGRLVYTVLAAVAEMERKRIRTRQKEGIEAARAAGKHLGRKPVVSDELKAEARKLVADGVPKRQAAQRLGISRTTFYKALAE